MPDPTYIYNARVITDDTTGWDANESYGQYARIEDAQEILQRKFRNPTDECRWLPVGGTWTGVDVDAKTWKLFTLIREDGETWEGTYPVDEYGDYPDDSGLGLYVIAEELRGV